MFVQDTYRNKDRGIGRWNPVTRSSTRSPQLGLSVAVGDLNGDGRNDIVISGSPMSAVLQGTDGKLGTGPGSLGSTFNLNVFSRSLGSEIRVADMDGNGANDIVFQAGDTTLGVLRQTAAGVFAITPDLYPVTLTLANFFHTFAVGDLSGDGRNDVVVLDPGNSGFLNIFVQNNGGTLNAPLRVPITSSPLFGVEIADIDGDGLNDIAGDVVNAGFPTGIIEVHVFGQNADHSFQSAVAYPFPTLAGGGSFHTSRFPSVMSTEMDGQMPSCPGWMRGSSFT